MDGNTVIRFRARIDREALAKELLQACKDKGITISELGNALLPALVYAVKNMQNKNLSIQEVVYVE